MTQTDFRSVIVKELLMFKTIIIIYLQRNSDFQNTIYYDGPLTSLCTSLNYQQLQNEETTTEI